MPNPIWTLGENVLSSTVITPSNFTIFNVDLSYFMEGRLKIRGIPASLLITSNFIIGVYNSFYGNSDTIPIFRVMVSLIGIFEDISIPFSSGLYTIAISNLDPSNNIIVSATVDKLSWPT